MTRNDQEIAMAADRKAGFGRRDFLRRGVVVTFAAGSGIAAGRGMFAAAGAVGGAGLPLAQDAPVPASLALDDYASMRSLRLMTTDGHFSFPGRRHSDKPVYGFGFREVDNTRMVGDGDGELNADPGHLITKYRGHILHTSPTLVVREGEELAVVVTNLGFLGRPDLDDSHSLHWHGFRNATSVFDGLPEASASVPPGRDLPYFYNPRRATVGQPKGSAGTYMYHCHFEDVEHVQMGMTGMIFVEPWDNWHDEFGAELEVPNKVAYNLNPMVDTSFDREFVLLMNEIDTRPHDGLETLQNFVWSDYDPQYWTINGRSYPDTVVPQIIPVEHLEYGNHAETLQMPDDGAGAPSPLTPDEVAESEMLSQWNSSLMQVREGDRVLLRLANLGYEIHSIELVGANDMKVIAHDAALLVGKDGTTDLTYTARRIELGPGEARDVIFTAPAFDQSRADNDVLADRLGKSRRFNRYLLKTRNSHRLTNAGQNFADGPGYAGAESTYGGMVTEVWVYPSDTNLNGDDALPEQSTVNETFPTLVVPAGFV